MGGKAGDPEFHKLAQLRDQEAYPSSFSLQTEDLELSEASPEPRIQPWTAKVWAGWSSHDKFFSAVSLGIYVPTSVLEPRIQMDGT